MPAGEPAARPGAGGRPRAAEGRPTGRTCANPAPAPRADGSTTALLTAPATRPEASVTSLRRGQPMPAYRPVRGPSCPPAVLFSDRPVGGPSCPPPFRPSDRAVPGIPCPKTIRCKSCLIHGPPGVTEACQEHDGDDRWRSGWHLPDTGVLPGQPRPPLDRATRITPQGVVASPPVRAASTRRPPPAGARARLSGARRPPIGRSAAGTGDDSPGTRMISVESRTIPLGNRTSGPSSGAGRTGAAAPFGAPDAVRSPLPRRRPIREAQTTLTPTTGADGEVTVHVIGHGRIGGQRPPRWPTRTVAAGFTPPAGRNQDGGATG